jgi:multiple sugar transport system substrate-binding protein
VAVWENGGDIITDDGTTCILNQPEAYEAIQWVADLALVENVAPKVEAQSMFDTMNPFMSGKVGTYIEGESNVGQFIQNIEDFEWATAWVPKGKELYSEGTATMFCMYHNTPNVDETWDFLKFLCADMRAYEVLNGAGKLGIPPLKAALEALFLNTEPRPDIKQVLAEMSQVNRIWMRNVTAGAEVKTTVDQGLARVWSGDQPAQEVCAELAAKVNQILANQPT